MVEQCNITRLFECRLDPNSSLVSHSTTVVPILQPSACQEPEAEMMLFVQRCS